MSGLLENNKSDALADGRMNRVFLDYYRCPRDFVDLRQSQEASFDPGYFRFGDILCYGSCSFASKQLQLNALEDVLPKTEIRDAAVFLPFDPVEVVENFRRECYVKRRVRKKLLKIFAQNAYYAARPWIAAGFRRQLHRLVLNRPRSSSFPSWPLDRTVDQLVEALLELSMRARKVTKIPFIWFWPDGYSSCAILTHDVETETGAGFCVALSEIDASYGFKASYQLVPEGKYSISESTIQTLRGVRCEINIHDLNHDGRLYQNLRRFLDRTDRINEYATTYSARGFRSGSLYRNADWYDCLSRFSYDMSIPNTAHLDPQKGGCCTVMPFFIGSILELPLTTTQDYSLFHILRDYSTALWEKQIELIMEKHGFISFNVHPDYIIESRARSVYIALLQYLSRLRDERKIWAALPGEVDIWWRQRSQMKLACDNGSWRIEGPGSERALIAYASVTENGLSYEVINAPSHSKAPSTVS